MKTGRMLIVSAKPLQNDGLTKIALLIWRDLKESMEIAFAVPHDENSEAEKELRRSRVKVYALPSKKKLASYLGALRVIVKKGRFDTVYIHGNSAMMFLEAFPAKLAGASKVITHCHNTNSDFPALHYALKPLLANCTDVRIACSEDAGKWAYPGGDFLVISNGIDLSRFFPSPELRARAREELGLDSELLAGLIGRFSPQKNHVFLLDVFQKLRELCPDARLLLIGEGELRPSVWELIRTRGLEDACILIPYTESPERYLNAMDVLIMPSLFEGFGLVALEALACGLPAVISERFPPDVRVSDAILVRNLSDGPYLWADAALAAVSRGRDPSGPERISEAGCTQERMLEQIRRVVYPD